MYKSIHGALALRQLHLSVLCPELVVLHHCVDVFHLFLLALEQLLGQLVEGVVGETCVAYNGKLCQEGGHLQLCEHVINREHPLAVGQLGELLRHLHVLYEIHVRTLGNGHLATLHLIARVGQDVEVATESEVLLVVGQKLQMETKIASHVDGVLNVIAVEGDGIFADRRGERILQEAYLVVVDVDVGENIFHGRCQDIACLNQFVDALIVHTLDDGFLVVRVTAINFLRHGLVDRDR